jgi:hypothetical protein
MHQLLSPIFADVLAPVLAPWGQAAAIILAIFLFVNILVGLAFTIALAFLFAWVRDKAELIKKLRPTIDAVNQAIIAPEDVEVKVVTDTASANQHRLAEVVQRVRGLEIPQKLEQVQHQAQSISTRVDQQADRVAETMIEIRARTVMVKGMLKAFFLPGLVYRERIAAGPQLPLLDGTSEAPGRDVPVSSPEAAIAIEKQLVEAGHEGHR